MKKTIIISIGTVLIIGAIVAVFFRSTVSNQKINQSSFSFEEFDLFIPEGWYVNTKNDTEIFLTKKARLDENVVQSFAHGPQMALEVLSSDQTMDTIASSIRGNSRFYDIRTVTFGEYEYLRVEGDTSDIAQGNDLHYYLPVKDVIYRFYLYPLRGGAQDLISFEDFFAMNAKKFFAKDTIVFKNEDSPLKNQESTTFNSFNVWDSYRNDKYGFQISIPFDLDVRPVVENVLFFATKGSPEPGTDNPYELTVTVSSGSECQAFDWKSVSAYYTVYSKKNCYSNGIGVEVSTLYSGQEVAGKILGSVSTWIPTGTDRTYGVTSPMPYIFSVSPLSGKKGTEVTIKGRHLGGFESDFDVYVQQSGGPVFNLYAGSIPDSYDGPLSVIKVKIEEPCKAGEKVYGRYSGIESICEYTEMTPGVYKIWMSPWGINTNLFSFKVEK